MHHASVWKFLDHIKKDQTDNEIFITQILVGHRNVKHPIKKSYQINQQRIERMVPVDNYQAHKDRGEIEVYPSTVFKKIALFVDFL